MGATLDAIQREHWRIRQDGGKPIRIRMTHDVRKTVLREWADNRASILDRASPTGDSILGLPVEYVRVGSLDAPCWQIMTT